MREYVEDDVALGLSAVLGDHTSALPPDALEAQIFNSIARLSPAEAESIEFALGDLGNAIKGSEVRGFVGGALPLVGTAVGTVYGGPVGAALGGSLGSAAGQAISGRSARPMLATQQQAATVPAPTPIPGAPLHNPIDDPAHGSAAAGQLLAVLQNPAVVSSLLALVLGQNGRTSVPVGNGNTQVPVGAMMNLIGVLANRAAEDAEAVVPSSTELPGYLLDGQGQPCCDPAVPSQRAEVLKRLLFQDPSPEWLEPGQDDWDLPEIP